MRFGISNVRSLCRVGALKSVVRELEKCKLDFMGVQDVRWEWEGYQIAIEFVSDRKSYITLKGHWCDIIVLNVHASTEDKDVITDSFYEEIEQIFDQFPRYHMKIMFGDFNAKVGREDILKSIFGNESLYEASNDNGVSNTTTFINTLGLLLMVSHVIR
jgi:hypothetical protein